eukprot:184698-Chlamydomonas_euryale.AAC.1
MKAFARLSAVYGGVYMLHKPDIEVMYDEAGAAVGVRSEGQSARCKFVVGDPSYFPEKTVRTRVRMRASGGALCGPRDMCMQPHACGCMGSSGCAFQALWAVVSACVVLSAGHHTWPCVPC